MQYLQLGISSTIQRQFQIMAPSQMMKNWLRSHQLAGVLVYLKINLTSAADDFD